MKIECLSCCNMSPAETSRLAFCHTQVFYGQQKNRRSL
ncbi:hypothetical protein CPter91_2879 [Collimonas pratensis]|uniref:Uncharacterized protein n=1 Tax=Collimonas pratensis TaxID=279113 RepID=A0A127Q5Z3_9BURK|nr:hypothetical protein CPter91_2879 [Collimonas pratensis]